jgi:hypothetical protein
MQVNIKSFDKVKFKERGTGMGKQARIIFDNGYGASIVQSDTSYGGREGLYEIAIILDGKIVYDTPLTSDVLGYLSEDEVSHYLQEISKLTPSTNV